MARTAPRRRTARLAAAAARPVARPSPTSTTVRPAISGSGLAFRGRRSGTLASAARRSCATDAGSSPSVRARSWSMIAGPPRPPPRRGGPAPRCVRPASPQTAPELFCDHLAHWHAARLEAEDDRRLVTEPFEAGRQFDGRHPPIRERMLGGNLAGNAAADTGRAHGCIAVKPMPRHAGVQSGVQTERNSDELRTERPRGVRQPMFRACRRRGRSGRRACPRVRSGGRPRRRGTVLLSGGPTPVAGLAATGNRATATRG
jgi:hypothetical protein